MPVAQSGTTPARQAILVGLGALLGVVAILFLVLQADRLLGSADLDIEIGDGLYRPGPADELADGIDDNGPLLLPDVAAGDRDIWLTHVGDDPDEGWRVFSARPATAARTCVAQWVAADDSFVDSCDGTVYPGDGTGLPQYPVVVDDDGLVTIDLSVAPAATPDTATDADDDGA